MSHRQTPIKISFFIQQKDKKMTVTIPQTRQPGDLITASMYNEIITALEHLLTLKADSTTIALAPTGKAIGWDVGDIKTAARLGDISNQWLICNGRTIGNVGSGASGRANADMQTLFSYLWDNFPNTVLAIQDSNGVASTRGANASADFPANKRLPLLDLRGRVVAGLDPDDTTLTQAWTKVLGGVGGAQYHRLTVDEIPAHTHTPSQGTSFLHGISAGGSAALTGGTSVTSCATTASAGGGADHNNLQPTIMLNYLIYTGL